MTREVEVVEGRARLLLPEAERVERGPQSKEIASVFYNPAMALNRDVSTLVLSQFAKDGWHALDGLAASGVRGLRYALESGAALNVHWNDWNPVAVRLIAENAKRNGVEPRVTQRNLNALLHEEVWHVVELDPYGSPAPFLDAATRAVRDRGLLGVTATDTTALAGVYPNVCQRRYMASPMHGELGHEVALRLLAGAAVRQAAKHEAALRPVLAHATDHYYRVTLAARRGATRADEALTHIGLLFACPACGERGFGDAPSCPACGGRVRHAGPLWTGPLVDADLAPRLVAQARDAPLARPEEARALVATLAEEAASPMLLVDLHKVGEALRTGSPPRAPVVDALRASGYRVGPVHFNRLAIRTDAPMRAVREAARAAVGG